MADWAAKRFWQNASVDQDDTGYVVLLDGRSVRTPAKTRLVVPTADLAQAIADEWQAQGEKIDPRIMPMTRSANAALDKVATQHNEVADLIAAYGENDLLCYRAESPAELVARQNAAWDPLLEWAANHLQARLICAQGVMHVAQPDTAVSRLHAQVRGQDVFALTALHDLVSLSGSLVIGLAAQHGAYDIDHLWAVSRIDENWQIEQWGKDDEEIELANTKRTAFEHAARFWQLSRF